MTQKKNIKEPEHENKDENKDVIQKKKRISIILKKTVEIEGQQVVNFEK